MNFPHLFSPLKVGPYQLKHRVMMAPLTPYERKTFYGDVAGYTQLSRLRCDGAGVGSLVIASEAKQSIPQLVET